MEFMELLSNNSTQRIIASLSNFYMKIVKAERLNLSSEDIYQECLVGVLNALKYYKGDDLDSKDFKNFMYNAIKCRLFVVLKKESKGIKFEELANKGKLFDFEFDLCLKELHNHLNDCEEKVLAIIEHQVQYSGTKINVAEISRMLQISVQEVNKHIMSIQKYWKLCF